MQIEGQSSCVLNTVSEQLATYYKLVERLQQDRVFRQSRSFQYIFNVQLIICELMAMINGLRDTLKGIYRDNPHLEEIKEALEYYNVYSQQLKLDWKEN